MKTGYGVIMTYLALYVEDLAEEEVVVCMRHICRCCGELFLELLETIDGRIRS
jgi:hypothetical protein